MTSFSGLTATFTRDVPGFGKNNLSKLAYKLVSLM